MDAIEEWVSANGGVAAARLGLTEVRLADAKPWTWQVTIVVPGPPAARAALARTLNQLCPLQLRDGRTIGSVVVVPRDEADEDRAPPASAAADVAGAGWALRDELEALRRLVRRDVRGEVRQTRTLHLLERLDAELGAEDRHGPVDERYARIRAARAVLRSIERRLADDEAARAWLGRATGLPELERGVADRLAVELGEPLPLHRIAGGAVWTGVTAELRLALRRIRDELAGSPLLLVGESSEWRALVLLGDDDPEIGGVVVCDGAPLLVRGGAGAPLDVAEWWAARCLATTVGRPVDDVVLAGLVMDDDLAMALRRLERKLQALAPRQVRIEIQSIHGRAHAAVVAPAGA